MSARKYCSDGLGFGKVFWYLYQMCAEDVDGEVGIVVMDAFTGQRWWRSGVEADAETSAV